MSESDEQPVRPEERVSGSRRRLASWVEARAQKVIKKVYETSAEDLESRARRAVSSAYTEKADDLEDRAVRALRRVVREELDQIKQVIEHSVEVKRREVRLSLLVLILAALVYLALEWLSRGTLA